MTNDPVLNAGTALRKKPFDWVALVCLIALTVITTLGVIVNIL